MTVSEDAPAPAELVSGDRPAVVVADFVTFTAQAPLSRAIARDNAGRTVLGVDVVTDLCAAPPPADLAQLAARYTPLPGATGAMGGPAATGGPGGAAAGTPGAVVGHCSAAGFAVHLHAALSAVAVRPPALVLVEPDWPTRDYVLYFYDQMRRRLGAEPDWADAPQVHGTAAADVLAAAHRILLADLDRMAEAEGLDEEDRDGMAELLIDRYRAWLGLLLASADTPSALPRQPVLFLLSDEGSVGGPGEAAPGAVVSRIPTTGDQLPEDPRVARRLHCWLDHGPSCPHRDDDIEH
jgi:hypothetical protein